jgi:uncharacterized protein with ParB-like and HNH nuclease domain
VKITQLIQDVYDYAFDEKNKHQLLHWYFSGFTNNMNNQTAYETIDGQQRLTTKYFIKRTS